MFSGDTRPCHYLVDACDGADLLIHVLNVTKDAVVTRRASIDPFAWPVGGLSHQTGPPMTAPHDPPAWWADALLTD